MFLLSETLQTLFLFGVGLAPLGGLVAGYLDRPRLLWPILTLPAVLLIVALGALRLALWREAVPNATGFEGLSFLLLPAIFCGTAILTFALFAMVNLLRHRARG